MLQSEVNRAVAKSTGESVKTIARLGFSIADPAVVDYDPEPCDWEGRTVDWDQVDTQRSVPLSLHHRREWALV